MRKRSRLWRGWRCCRGREGELEEEDDIAALNLGVVMVARVGMRAKESLVWMSGLIACRDGADIFPGVVLV